MDSAGPSAIPGRSERRSLDGLFPRNDPGSLQRDGLNRVHRAKRSAAFYLPRQRLGWRAGNRNTKRCGELHCDGGGEWRMHDLFSGSWPVCLGGPIANATSLSRLTCLLTLIYG